MRWFQSGAGYYLGRCALSSDGSALYSGWYRNTFLQNKVTLHTTASNTPVWTYLYTQASGGYQDIPTGVDVTPDGAWAVVGSWGDQHNTNPEIHVFGVSQPGPVFTYDTPGSMFDAAITADGDGGAYVAAGGKHVHANEFGSGGDLFAIHIDEPTAVLPAAAASPAGLALAAWPNPFNPRCTLSFTLAAAGHARLEIFDTSGRRVCGVLDAELTTGAHAIVWDGRTDAGAEVASGVYLARLASAGATATQSLVLLR
jgi:hypothetical protein